MVIRKEKAHFTFWYHVNNNMDCVEGINVFRPSEMQEALNEALQQRQEEIVSQVEDWNNIEGLNVHQIIKRLKELT